MTKKVESYFLPEEKFRAALNFCLEKRGRGTLTKLAQALGKSVSLIGDIKSGRRPGDEKLKQRIALYFGYTYEEFLQLGAKLLAEKNKDKISIPFPDFVEIISLPSSERFKKVFELAGKHTGFNGPILHALEERVFKDEKPKLETEEEIVAEYQKWLKWFEEKKKLLLEE